MNVDTDALVRHLIAQTRSNVSFLIAQNQISHAVGQEILDRLPSAGPSIPDPVTALSNQASNMRLINPPSPLPSGPTSYNAPSSGDFNPTPPSNTVRAKALWGYNEDGNDPQDLSFQPGDIIEIVQETNNDWWTGRYNGREGLFPSTYVEKLSSAPSSRPPAPPVPRTSTFKSNYNNNYSDSRPLGSPAAPNPTYPPYVPPGPPPPGAYGPPPTGYYQSPPPPAPMYNNYGPPPPGPVMVSASAPPAPVDADPPKKSRFGGMGNTLATAAVGGLGFGAGSAIGSDVVNSIF